MSNNFPAYFKYWGKAGKDGSYHLLPYHCLDVAAVGSVWLEEDDPLRYRIACAIGMDEADPLLIAYINFFLALHDLGKFDIRFQSKVPELRNKIWPDLDLNDLLLSPDNIIGFDHGKAGYDLFLKFYPKLLGLLEQDDEILDKWRPWIKAVTGHHGVLPILANWQFPNTEQRVIDHDKNSREQWLKSLIKIFLKNNSNFIDIPELPTPSIPFFAGFCSVVDWIASNELFVRWVGEFQPLGDYFKGAKDHCYYTKILYKTGLVGKRPNKYSGILSLLNGNNPRQIQTLIDDLSNEAGLTIIEGATGSGKTEAALALAWKMIENKQANTIVFALPTQATADAMLERIQKLTPILFKDGDANLVLAHGKREFNEIFADLKAASKLYTGQAGNQGLVQCAEWIATSRKRVFLGQIGVCTIDQVLLSVLPVRHNFVRSFGLMKSVLIIDEVHAYDRYMYGLLEEILKAQKASGGCAILLSATLPTVQKMNLFKAWNNNHALLVNMDDHYPLLSRISVKGESTFQTVDKKNKPPDRNVEIELSVSNDMEPDVVIANRLFEAAKCGATVAVVCNLVQSAQKLTMKLREIVKGTPIQVDIFHARYRFKDRQIKESIAKKMYGNNPRKTGRILVATQVVEQSLDLDFDWLVTQLCPIDFLFQRIGRLHRHERHRPSGFEKPLCTILLNNGDDFNAHEIIYGDTRVLWRTRELLKNCNGSINFPKAYREWIEAVYGNEEWKAGAEPDSVIGKSSAFKQFQQQLWYEAKIKANTDMNPFADIDQNTVSLTRGKEMGLTVVPILAKERKKVLLDGECLEDVNKFGRDEFLNMNSISAPANWKWLPPFEEGYIYLPMEQIDDGWVWMNGNYSLKYTTDLGLERLEADK